MAVGCLNQDTPPPNDDESGSRRPDRGAGLLLLTMDFGLKIGPVTSDRKMLEFGQAGYLVAAPDLFWRTVPGPLSRTDDRTKTRSQPRLDVIRLGEQDMVDTLKTLAQYSQFNGRAIAMGFCYGGPYAILGPKRLGYSGGVSCHGTQLGDFAHELNGTTQPISIIWGDQDHAAPAAVQAMYRAIPQTHKNVAVHIFPGILHGYMMKENPTAFDQGTREFSMNEALKLLQGLHTS